MSQLFVWDRYISGSFEGDFPYNLALIVSLRVRECRRPSKTYARDIGIAPENDNGEVPTSQGLRDSREYNGLAAKPYDNERPEGALLLGQCRKLTVAKLFKI